MLIISALILTALISYSLGRVDRPGASQREWDAYNTAVSVLERSKTEEAAQ
ncbi:hypothetical protein [Corynebacterium terpenotabidum]|uniref:hypothetical protein n=1 Tax=Corynebacterium terpenotabidum TaxID=89154 RepID=UPI0003F9BC0E|nr:hypothetical protein [Corynebacterium terpenotabidum]